MDNNSYKKYNFFIVNLQITYYSMMKFDRIICDCNKYEPRLFVFESFCVLFTENRNWMFIKMKLKLMICLYVDNMCTYDK